MKWNLNEDRPIWIQLKEQLGKQIVSGRFQYGEKLPSVRELAKEAGVNPNTMQRALASLDQDGLTSTNRTSGRCVTTDKGHIDSVIHLVIHRNVRRTEELCVLPRNVLHLFTDKIDFRPDVLSAHLRHIRVGL